MESTQSIIIPELVELTNDEETSVRLAGLETITNLLNLLDDGRNLKKSLFYYRVVSNSQCNIFYIRGDLELTELKFRITLYNIQ